MMDPVDQKLDHAAELFEQALLLPEGERAAFLDDGCAGDDELRGLLTSLLAARGRQGTFLAEPTATAEATELPTPCGGEIGTRVGHYELRARIGEGGFGTVYLAEQCEPVRRRVALKVVKPGMDSRQVIARFEAERQALALMDHPNIARVLDAGATEAQSPLGAGRPYFVMELVQGTPITKYCDDQRLPIRRRLELFVTVCNAVQHAHQKGIIHRDLKPTNILVAEEGSGFGVQGSAAASRSWASECSECGGDGVCVPESRTLSPERGRGNPVVKVIDFGIAKAMHGRLTDKTVLTEARQLVGTPAYMSPEQAQMGGIDIDTRSDIYALGVLLYELLTGTTPFDAKSLLDSDYDELRRIIREVEPEKPSIRVGTGGMVRTRERGKAAAADDSGSAARSHDSAAGSAVARARGCHDAPTSHSRELRGELDWIVMKCLEKDRARRYETANGLAADIARHLAGEPVVAAPPSRAYRMRKLLRRNRGVVLSGGLIVATLVVGLVGTSFGLLRANRERDLKDDALRAEEGLRRESERVTGVLEQLLAPENWRQKHSRSLLTPQQLDAFVANHLGSLSDQPRAEAHLRSAIGLAYLRNDTDKARPHFARALELRRRAYGDHALTARSLIDWARLCNATSDFGGADRALSEALRIQEQLSGPARADITQTLLTQAYTEHLRGHARRALELSEQALGVQRAALGGEHSDIADTLLTIGDYLANLGELDEAERRVREALAMDRRLRGDVHIDVAYGLDSLGRVLRQRRDFAGSEAALRQSLAIVEQLYGPDDRELTGTLENLAATYTDAGRIDDAIDAERRLFDVTRRCFGLESEYTSNALVGLCRDLVSRGCGEDAVALHRDVLAQLERDHSGGDPVVTRETRLLAELLESLGRTGEALALAWSAAEWYATVAQADPDRAFALMTSPDRAPTGIVRILTTLHADSEADALVDALRAALAAARGNDLPEAADAQYELASCFGWRGRYAEELEARQAVLEIRQRAYPADDSRVAEAMTRLGWCLERRLDRPGEARPWLESALAIYQRNFQEDTPTLAWSLESLGHCLQRLERYDEAATKYAEVLQMRRRLSPTGREELAVAHWNLGCALADAGRAEEALEQHRAALAMYQSLFPGDHREPAEALAGVADCLVQLGRPGEALPLHEAALEMRQRLFTGDHQAVADSLNRVAQCRQMLRQPELALPLYEAALAMYQRLDPEDGLNQMWAMAGLGTCLAELNRPAEALDWLEEALQMRRRFVADDRIAAKWLETMAGSLRSLKRMPEAVATLDEIVALRQRLSPADDPDVVARLNDAAYLLLRELRRPADALPRYETALAMLQRVSGDDRQVLAWTLCETAHCLYALERPEEARPRFEAALAMWRRLKPDGDADIAASLGPLGLTALEHGFHADAEAPLRACAEMRARVIPPEDPEHWRVTNTWRLVAAALVGQGRLDEADALLRDRAAAVASTNSMKYWTNSILGGEFVDQAAELADADRARAIELLSRAEPLLLAGHEGLAGASASATDAARLHGTLERLAKLYETWQSVAPDTARARQAAEWRDQLEAREATAAAGPAP